MGIAVVENLVAAVGRIVVGRQVLVVDCRMVASSCEWKMMMVVVCSLVKVLVY